MALARAHGRIRRKLGYGIPLVVAVAALLLVPSSSAPDRLIEKSLRAPTHSIRSEGAGCHQGNCSSGNLSSNLGGTTNFSAYQIAPGGPGYVGTPAPNSTALGNPAGNGSLAYNAAARGHIRPDSCYCSTYYYAANYQSSNLTGTNQYQILYTSVFIPSALPYYGDDYNVLINAFDNAGWFDQIGLVSDYVNSGGNPYDNWAINWDQVDYQGGLCNPNVGGSHARVVYTASGLTPDSWYTFFMYLSGSHLEFRVYSGNQNMNGTPVWSNNSNLTDTASQFEIAEFWNAGNCNLYGFMNMQESHLEYNGQNVPPWDFYFGYTTGAYWDNGVPGWRFTGFPNSDYAASCLGVTCPVPNGYYYLTYYNGGSGRILTVVNEVVREYFSYGVVSVSTPGSTAQVGSASPQGPYCSSFSCSFTVSCTFPSGWTGSIADNNPVAGTITPTLYWNLSIPSGVTYGNYLSTCTLSISSTSPVEWTTFVWLVEVP